MEPWHPHVTVAVVVEREGRFLMVEERCKQSGKMVFNQPAGHLEAGETLQQAALREAREETGWQVELNAVLGLSIFESPLNGHTYARTTFSARAIAPLENAELDPDIHRVHWLTHEEIVANSAKLRSPLVLASIERYQRGEHYPLDLIYNA